MEGFRLAPNRRTASKLQRVIPGRRRAWRGQAAVELALILPVFVLLVLAAVDFGQVMYGYVTTSSAAQAGAEYAARTQDFTNAGIKSVILGASGGFLTTGNTCLQPPTCTGNPPVQVGTQVKMVVVTVRYTFTLP